MEMGVHASFGIAVHPMEAMTPSYCCNTPTSHCHRRRELGARQRYARERDPYKPERLALAADLRRAIETGQLALHYQPKVRFAQRRARRRRSTRTLAAPQLGMLSPDRFIPLAEQTGLISRSRAGFWKRRCAVRALARRRTGSARGSQSISQEPAQSGADRLRLETVSAAEAARNG